MQTAQSAAPGDLLETIKDLPRDRASLLPALQRLHESLGWLSLGAIAAAADHCRTPRSEAHGVASHFPDFRLAEPSGHIVNVCTGVACQLRGSKSVLEACVQATGLEPGQSNQSWTFETSGCLFACSVAPVFELDGTCYGEATAESAPAFLSAREAHRSNRGTESESDLRSHVSASPAVSLSHASALATACASIPRQGESPVSVLDSLRAAAQARARPSSERQVFVTSGRCADALGARAVLAAARAIEPSARVVGCDGRCYAGARIRIVDGAREHYFDRVDSRDVPEILAGRFAPTPIDDVLARQPRVALDQVGEIDPTDFDDALRRFAYARLARVLERAPEAVINEVRAAELAGRGGAYFPTAIKWDGARKATGSPKYLIVNAEEGEPGVFKDRHLIEGNPHRLIEGALIAAYAIGASKIMFFVNGEARPAVDNLRLALDQAIAAEIVGDSVLGSGFGVVAEVKRGAGGFILGEETALMEALEGRRAMPRLKPPMPTESGLFGCPTVINNAETLMQVVAVLAAGADAFRVAGVPGAGGTKVFALAGDVCRPGVAELRVGATLRNLIEDIGGGAPDGIQAVLVGGPSGVLVGQEALDAPLAPRGQFGMGSGGVAVIGRSRSIRDVVRTLLAYNAAESCGKCTPCREGTVRLLEMMDEQGQGTAPGNVQEMRALSDVIISASLCGLGKAAPLALLGALDRWPNEFK